MATPEQIKAFIKLIAPDVQEAYKRVGKVKPSVCIGMACVESGAGTSKLMFSHNALWGQKVGTGKTATKYWGGKFFTSKTKEEYQVGVHSVITSAFRAYDSILQGACNYYELLNTSLYARVKADADYKTQMEQIKQCGYMTSSTEVNSVLKYISAYNLTQYDNVRGDNTPHIPAERLLKKGSKGESVKWLQERLNALNGANLNVDGVYGDKTKKAVIEWQAKKGLNIDGIAGEQTIKSLGG